MNNASALVSLIAGVSYLWIGFFNLQADRGASVNRLFALLCLFFSIWSFGAVGISLSGGTGGQAGWERIAYFGAEGYVGAAFFLFSAIGGFMPTLRRRPLLAAVILLPLLILQTANLGWNLISPRHGPSPWYYAHHFLGHAINIVGLAIVWSWGKRTKLRRERLQSRWILWSALICILVGLAVDFAMDPRGYISQGNVVPLIWVLSLHYAIKRFGFLRISPANATRFLMDGIDEYAYIVDCGFIHAEMNVPASRLMGDPGAVRDRIPVGRLFADSERLQERLAGLDTSGVSRLEVGVLAISGSSTTLLRAVFFLVRDQWEDPIGYIVIAREWRSVADFARRYSLSEREEQVLRFILIGSSQREIAERLFLSLPTIKSHTTSLYNKLGVNSRNEVWAMCVEK